MILSLSNYIPENIVDVCRFIGGMDTGVPFTQNHFCSYAGEFIAAANCPSVDGVVVPNSCDCIRTAIDYMRECGTWIYQLKHPTFYSDAAVAYFAGQLKRFQDAAAELAGAITREQIAERGKALNERNARFRLFYKDAGRLVYSSYINMINGALARSSSVPATPAYTNDTNNVERRKLYIIGPFLTDTSILEHIEEAGFVIAGDNLTNSKRLINTVYPVDGALEALREGTARAILQTCASPVSDNFERMLHRDLAEMRSKGIHACLFLCKKFCEVYDYLYAYYASRLEAANIAALRVYTDEPVNPAVFETFYDEGLGIKENG
jgi:benzoyl-CoA reductase/2-hydroxyglutaryl-CoA dehydratase subunit BcrC/BadD/HgdB